MKRITFLLIAISFCILLESCSKEESPVTPVVTTPSEGIVLDPSDTRFAEILGPDNQKIIYYGIKDNNGYPVEITHFELIKNGDQSDIVSLKNGKVKQVKFFDGSFANFDYDSVNNRVAILLKKDTSEVRFTVPYNNTAGVKRFGISGSKLQSATGLRIKVSSKNNTTGETGRLDDAVVRVNYTMEDGRVLSGFASLESGPVVPGDPSIYSIPLPVHDPSFTPGILLLNGIIESIISLNFALCDLGIHKYLSSFCPTLKIINFPLLAPCEGLALVVSGFCKSQNWWDLETTLNNWKNKLTNAIINHFTEHISINVRSVHEDFGEGIVTVGANLTVAEALMNQGSPQVEIVHSYDAFLNVTSDPLIPGGGEHYKVVTSLLPGLPNIPVRVTIDGSDTYHAEHTGNTNSSGKYITPYIPGGALGVYETVNVYAGGNYNLHKRINFTFGGGNIVSPPISKDKVR